jgi:hypothetical protein
MAEAARLAIILRADPASMIAAAIEGWDFPLSREAAAILDLFDLEHVKAAGRKAKPHGGRPWANAKRQQRFGNTAGRTHEQVREILRAHGHDI